MVGFNLRTGVSDWWTLCDEIVFQDSKDGFFIEHSPRTSNTRPERPHPRFAL